MYDIIIKNGTIVDGSGKESYSTDIFISDGKIASLCKTDDSCVNAKKIIDASGLTVTPGFIDNHSHSDLNFLVGTDASNMLEQGITTEIAGHCGASTSPSRDMATNLKNIMSESKCISSVKACQNFSSFMEYADNLTLGTNMAFYIGHGSVRQFIMNFDNRIPTNIEMGKMK